MKAFRGFPSDTLFLDWFLGPPKTAPVSRWARHVWRSLKQGTGGAFVERHELGIEARHLEMMTQPSRLT